MRHPAAKITFEMGALGPNDLTTTLTILRTSWVFTTFILRFFFGFGHYLLITENKQNRQWSNVSEVNTKQAEYSLF